MATPGIYDISIFSSCCLVISLSIQKSLYKYLQCNLRYNCLVPYVLSSFEMKELCIKIFMLETNYVKLQHLIKRRFRNKGCHIDL